MKPQFDEFDQLREQYQQLEQTLDKEAIITDDIIAGSMAEHIDGLHRVIKADRVFTIGLFALVPVCVVGVAAFVLLVTSLVLWSLGGLDFAMQVMKNVLARMPEYLLSPEFHPTVYLCEWCFFALFVGVLIVTLLVFQWEKRSLHHLETMILKGDAPGEIAHYARNIYLKARARWVNVARLSFLSVICVLMAYSGWLRNQYWELIYLVLIPILWVYGIIGDRIATSRVSLFMGEMVMFGRKLNILGFDYHIKAIIDRYSKLADE